VTGQILIAQESAAILIVLAIAEARDPCFSVIASEAKQSRVARTALDRFASLAMTGLGELYSNSFSD
jgi:hypothetical protein